MLSRKSVEKPNTGGDANPDFDPNKVLDKIGNYKAPKTANFDRMTSRPCDNGPLPSYMKVNTFINFFLILGNKY